MKHLISDIATILKLWFGLPGSDVVEQLVDAAEMDSLSLRISASSIPALKYLASLELQERKRCG